MPTFRSPYILVLTCFLLLLSGCSLRPSQDASTSQAPATLIKQHQAQIEAIAQWHIRGRMAFFNTLEDDRSTATLTWQKETTLSSLRLSHPLRGTLARLTQTATQASLTDMQGKSYYAPTVDQLLAWQLGIHLPFQLVEQAITGRKPAELGNDYRYYPDGTLASYQVASTSLQGGQDLWHIALSRYKGVDTPLGTLLLPHELEITHANYRIRLQINNWSQIQ
ncbi:lipoprotein insertase outer membrane protein LolB [Aliidiomarina taiwanensis]|nr:lipoprotein insertase outer membrane protein LolB [Aliidiomarina taiwanensis]